MLFMLMPISYKLFLYRQVSYKRLELWKGKVQEYNTNNSKIGFYYATTKKI